ncbi:hypothetical protein CLAIMM_13218 [Cladophialophora immunda]|nr:hypothetical protein CLAIMM_13218 [Cladophialophora immunda]
MSAMPGPSQPMAVSNNSKVEILPSASGSIPSIEAAPFEPCASSHAVFLFAQGSTILCLHHYTLAIQRRFEKHSRDVRWIEVDNISVCHPGRVVLSYDVGQTAIVWDLETGDQVSRFVSYEAFQVAQWMRNGKVVFGDTKGHVILFEPGTGDHIATATIYEPITAIAPFDDCKRYAIGYKNGLILLTTLQPAFAVLHSLAAYPELSTVISLTFHRPSSESDNYILAGQTANGDLRVWAIPKLVITDTPRVIRLVRGSTSNTPSRHWISWSRNGRIVQFSEGRIWAWDVRTKEVTYEAIPTVEGIRAIAAYGPTSRLFTLGPDFTVQQYDVERAQLVANVRHMPMVISPRTFEDTTLNSTKQRWRLSSAADISDSGLGSPKLHPQRPGTTEFSDSGFGSLRPYDGREESSNTSGVQETSRIANERPGQIMSAPRIHVADHAELHEIESQISNTQDIGSHLEVLNIPEIMVAEEHLTKLLKINEEILKILNGVPDIMESSRLQRNLSRLLKTFYIDLFAEATSNLRKSTANLLRSHNARHRISKSIVGRLKRSECDPSSEDDSEPARPIHRKSLADVEAWIRNNMAFSEPIASLDDELPRISHMEEFVLKGPAFKRLLANLQLFVIPSRYAQLKRILMTIPKERVNFSYYIHQDWLSKCKCSLQQGLVDMSLWEGAIRRRIPESGLSVPMLAPTPAAPIGD